MTDLPDAAVEAAARRLCAFTSDDESGWYCETHGTEIHVAGLYYCATGEDDARAALTAAAPHIVKQSTTDLRAGIEVLRDEWRMHEAANLRAASTQPESSSGLLLHTVIAGLCKAHADALDALIGGA